MTLYLWDVCLQKKSATNNFIVTCILYGMLFLFYSAYCNSFRRVLVQSRVMPFQAALLTPCPAAAHVLSDQAWARS
jgi:hypothetical protein